MTPTRPEFLHLTKFEKVLFYVLVFGSIAFAAWTILQRVKAWKQGKPVGELREGFWYWVPTKAAFAKWWKNVSVYILGQKKVKSSRKKSGAPMHLMIFYGFLSLLLATTLLAFATYAPLIGLPNFHQGTYYLVYELVFDLLGLFFVFGVIWALIRRWQASKQELGEARLKSGEIEEIDKQIKTGRRRPITTAQSDYLTLWLLLLVGITGYVLEAARISNQAAAGSELSRFDSYSVVGSSLASIMPGLGEGAYKFIWWFHMVWVIIFFAVIPRMRIRHIVMAIASSAGKPETRMGELKPISMAEVEETGQIGAATVADLSRWHLMSLDACMECGRCTEVCPAWNVGKVLNPKQVVQDVRGALTSGTGLIEAIGEEALWACTTCNACVEACPVLIRHVDIIVDSRRNLVAEGKLSGTAAVMLRQTGSSGNAWGAPRNERESWMKDLDIPLARNGVDFEYLFWVGCAGATDPGAVKTTKAVAALLKKAGVSFACLGQEEACTGDPARRVGDEFTFQEKAMENVSTFERYKVKKVVTACPHCFNTLLNEYHDPAGDPSIGHKMEVFHHTQLFQKLIAEGKLKPADGRGTVIHDPCYLGRVNGEADAPRALLGEQTNYNGKSPDGLNGLIRPDKLIEPKFYASKTRCCGAGGGRMWMEEPNDQRPGNARAQELLGTGAKTIALGCPFCRIMLDASVKQETEEEIRLVDLAEMLNEANA